MMEVT